MDSVQRIVSDTRADAAPAAPAVPEQLRFELLLLELSTGFINLPAGRIDEAIQDGLRRIVEALGIERSTLNWLQMPSGRVEITHSYAVPGVEPAPRITTNRELWPWAWAQLTANRPVVFASLDELPPEASVDRANWEGIGLRSHVTMPLIVGGELYGGLSFGSIRSERAWPAELLGRMRLVAQILGNALARKHAQEELDRALDFDRLATRVIAALLIGEPSDDDRAIERGLGDIGRFLGVDRVGLWEALAPRGEFHLAYHWAADGAEAPSVRLTAVELPWITGRLRDGSVVRFSRHAELPPQAAAEVATLRALGVHALLAVPFSVSGGAAGALSFESTVGDRAWPEGLIPGAMLLAEVFASLHARRSSERRTRAAEVEAAQWRERLAHLVRVHTAGEMSAALAHEITQPLGAIENYALAARRRLVEDSPDRTRVTELLDKVIGQASRAGDVVTRMRGMVQRHDLEPREIDVERAVRDCVEMVKTDCELRDIRIELKAAGRLPRVVADEIHLQQVILNLLRNAMEAVELPQPGVFRRIAIDVARDDAGAVSVAVADRGPGIAEGDLERVFESFYSTKPRGLGIGLAICRKLIEAHGGALWAAHNPGGGAVFRFTLPVATSVD